MTVAATPEEVRERAPPIWRQIWARRHGVIAFVVMFLVWEAAVHVFRVPSYLVPPPTEVWHEFVRRWPTVSGHVVATTSAIVAGFAVAVVISVPLALAIVQWRFAERSVYPVIVFLQIVPKIAIAPVFVIWFGVGFTPKVLLVFLLCFFPIVVASIAGFRSVRPEVLDLARSSGATAWRTFVRIALPSALPSIFTGLKVASAIAATAAVVAEFVASDRGLGYLLLQYNAELNTSMVFGIIVLLSIIGVAIYYAVELVERLAIPWHVSHRGNGAQTSIG